MNSIKPAATLVQVSPAGPAPVDPAGLTLPPDVVHEMALMSPCYDYTDGGRMTMEVVTASGAAAALEFRVRLDTVEIQLGSRCLAIYDRDHLRGWLRSPDDPVQVDDVRFHLDHAVDVDGRVAVTLPGVTAWTLSPTDLENLQARL